jgi:hypothetical protein
MKFSLNLVSRSLAATLAVAALAAPAGAQSQNMRSPDAKDSATLQRPVDVRDAPGYPAVAWQSRATAVRTPAPAQANDDAFDWRSAAIGAAVAAALAFVLFAYRTRPRVAR